MIFSIGVYRLAKHWVNPHDRLIATQTGAAEILEPFSGTFDSINLSLSMCSGLNKGSLLACYSKIAADN
jgi:hypothetical protein